MGRKAVWPPTVHVRHGQAFIQITVQGERVRIPLGPAGSTQAEQEYARILQERASGRMPERPAGRLTVAQLALGFLEHAHRREEPRTYRRTQRALEATVRLYGHTEAAAFRPRHLEAVRAALLTEKRRDDETLSRSYVNKLVDAIRRCWRWGVKEHDLPSSLWHDLVALENLHKGDPGTREAPRVVAVEEERVLATLPFLPPIPADMVRLQLLTGARPGEVCALRPGDIDWSWRQIDGVAVGLYRLDEHKNDWRGHLRWIPMGPRARALLLPYLLRPGTCYCFSPQESALGRSLRTGRRLTLRGRVPRERYTTETYDKAVERACAKGKIAPWAPNQIRHRVLTDVETEYGREDARCVGGHRTPSVTARYAESVERAARVIARMG